MERLKQAEDWEKRFKDLEGNPEERERVQKAANAVRELEATSLDDVESTRDKAHLKEVVKGFGEAKNGADGRRAIFPAKMVGKLLGHQGFDYSRVLGKMKDLYEGAVPAFFETEEVKEGHKDHTSNFAGYHHYVNKVTLDGKEYYVRLTVQEPRTRGDKSVADQMHSAHVTDVQIYDTDGGVTSGIIDPTTTGVGVKTDAKLQRFFALASGNAHEFAKALRWATGWERGVDGKWRWEEMEDAVVPDEVYAQMRRDSEAADGDVSSWEGTLGELLGDHAVLEAYPRLRDVRVHLFTGGDTEEADGFYSEALNAIRLSGRDKGELDKGLVHEVQHAIQHIEGFAKGGMPEWGGEDRYHRLGGEVEARNASTRMGWSEEKRRGTLLSESEDVG
ncbi:MAG: hypothetical protein LIP02_04950, partial [Bacteroidales bacterium]|nr:hypothetical protein [Bacteroidales bacterium]